MEGFTHLHVHTEYSLLDGSGKIKEMVKRAKELGMESLAITDHGVMYGVVDFYEAAGKEGIKPILGCEIYVAPGSRFDKESSVSESRYNHLILLAENNTGFANLIKIVSIGFTEGYYYKPRVDIETLEKYHEGLIATSACLAGSIPTLLIMQRDEEAKNEALRLRDIFGKDNFFLELQDHGIMQQKYVNAGLIRISKETGIGLICTNDVHYINKEDSVAHDILLCIQTGAKVSDENRMRYEGGQFYLKSEEEMRELFGYVPEALANTKKIADRCNVTIEFGVTKLPKYEYPKEYPSSYEYLKSLCENGLKARYKDTDSVHKRLITELDVINNMGYVDYFLIVWDYVNYAKENNIPVGPGRGSAAGSIVSYCLGITDIDPIEYSLVFERFLNPERISMPDIDMDFCYERRQEVIDYVIRKYGKECVSQIITFGTMAARAAIKDVGRVLDVPYAKADHLAKMVPQAVGMTIDKALEENPDFRQEYQENEDSRELVDMARKLEGLPRHSSVHAAGVLICDRPVDDYVPVSIGANGEAVAAYTMTTLERLGLLKMDFLGLRTLTVIKDAQDNIRKINPEFSIEEVPIDDKHVYEYISTGKTDGMFQLESAGMKSFMKELKPSNIEDLIAGISLYRPGPMEFIPQYIKGKNNPSEVSYACEQLEPILRSTYGCIVYQEQVMQIVRDMAGYSWGRSDLVRRAMSKKKADVINKEKQNFIYGNEEEGVPGCIKNGIPEKVAENIYDSILDFANYAFNKSHAASYAVISYRTAYLKTYYPVEFMASLLTSVIDNIGKVAEYIYACRQMGIEILPPDVNRSGGDFSVEYSRGKEQGSIRFGLNAVKSIGVPTIKEIVKERNNNGAFKGLNDFIRRLSRTVNKRNIENLIKAGAFDQTGDCRKEMMSVYAEMLDAAVKKKKDEISGQMSLMDLFSNEADEAGDDTGDSFFNIKIPKVGEFDTPELLEFEKEVLGIYISGHPLDEVINVWKNRKTATGVDFVSDTETGKCKVEDNKSYVVGGIINEVKTIATKKGQIMAFVTLEDALGSMEVILFPRVYDSNRVRINEGEKIFIIGNASVDASGEAKLIAEKINTFDEIPKKLWIRLKDEEAYKNEKAYIDGAFEAGGRADRLTSIECIIIYLEKEKKKITLPTRNIKTGSEVLKDLNNHFGKDNIELT